jgi:hypothetical protein
MSAVAVFQRKDVATGVTDADSPHGYLREGDWKRGSTGQSVFILCHLIPTDISGRAAQQLPSVYTVSNHK